MRDHDSTAVLGLAPKAVREQFNLKPGMTLEPTASISRDDLARLHPADIARRLGRHDVADRIEDQEISAMLGEGLWEFES